jgi:hypothetical protein
MALRRFPFAFVSASTGHVLQRGLDRQQVSLICPAFMSLRTDSSVSRPARFKLT